MDINENNFKILTEYLSNTLSPDPSVRRPGESIKVSEIFRNIEKLLFLCF